MTKRLARLGNAFVVAVLRSRWHRVLSRRLLVVRYEAHSGRAITVPVSYARCGDALIVVPGRAGTKTWWRHFLHGAPARIVLDGAELEGWGEVVDPDRAVLGLALYLGRFPRAARMLCVHLSIAGRPNPEQLSWAGRRQQVVVFDVSAEAAERRGDDETSAQQAPRPRGAAELSSVGT